VTAVIALLVSASMLSTLFGLLLGTLGGVLFSLLIFFMVTLVMDRGSRLRVTKLEFISTFRRPAGRGAGPVTVVVNTADVQWLEYKSDEWLGIAGVRAAGLYAVKKRGVECLLPFLNPEQTARVIGAIEAAFPGLGEMWRNNLQARAVAR